MPVTSPASEIPADPRAGFWDRRGAILLGALLLAAGLLLAYSNSFRVPFLLDDDDSISKNPTIRSFSTALFPPTNSGITVSGRPLLNLSFAINHRLGGKEVFGYHAGNLLIHFAAALCLFGIVRRTLKFPALAPRFGPHATPLAWCVSALWAVHPLQTESVTYIVQRAESLVGLFYLLTLYAFIRSVEKPSRAWTAAAVIACVLGMAAKEVMASAPLVIFLYDRTFVSGSFRESWRRHGKRHLAFAATWLVLLTLVISSGGRGATVGFGVVSWNDYVLTQGPGIATYLWHAIFPSNLVFDYGAIVEKRPLVVAGGVSLILALLALVIVLLRKRPVAGFVGAWFFLILAPTSSVIPVATQTLAEHRMYLPLAAIVVAVAFLLHHFRRQLAWTLLPLLVIGAIAGTFDRNRDYRSNLAIWEDTVRKVPDNVRALNNVSLCYRDLDRFEDARRNLKEAIALAPGYANAYSNLGLLLMRKGLGRPADGKGSVERPEAFIAVSTAPRDETLVVQALGILQRAVELEPTNALYNSVFGTALLDAGDIPASLDPLAKAVSYAPNESIHRFNYANALAQLDRNEEAAVQYVAALRLEPGEVDYLTNYGLLLRRMRQLPESLEKLQAAAKLKPDSARVHSNLGISLLASGRADEGIRELQEALRLNPDLPQARYNLGAALAESGRAEEAIGHFEALLKVAAPTAELCSNLGVLYARAGRIEEAIAQMRRALTLDPNHAGAKENLAKLTAYLRNQPKR
ncbi:MAG TPA: tetratricopeptide repeat protein [Opitutaceae bacterium]|nr:tetratricopeptide repeat protein [Opitutaceae bacterium]